MIELQEAAAEIRGELVELTRAIERQTRVLVTLARFLVHKDFDTLEKGLRGASDADPD